MVRIFRLMLVLFYIYIYNTNIPPILLINRVYETQSSVAVACFLPGQANDLSAPMYNIPPIMIIIRIYETQTLLSL
jgi:hypothetical protein